MKRLEHGQEKRADVHERARSPASFWKRMKDAAMVGVALVGLGGCAHSAAGISPSVNPGRLNDTQVSLGSNPAGLPSLYSSASAKQAVSPTATTVEIGGRTLTIVRLDTQLAELDRQTARYREPEELPVEMGGTGPLATTNGRYANSVLVPNEARFIVTLNSREGTRRLDIVFSRDRCSDPSPDLGTCGRGVDLTDFATYVRTLSGQEMARVNFIVETGTFNNSGVTTNYTNAYIFPMNASGRVITRHGNGEYIIYSASYYASSAGGTTALLVEPNGRDSLYASR